MNRLRPTTLLASPGLRALLALGMHSASQFWVVSLLAHFTSPEAVGYYVFGYAVCAPVFMFLGARHRIVLANDVCALDSTWTFVRFRAASSAVAMLLICLGALLLVPTEKVLVVVLIGAIKAAEAISDICYGGMQRLQALQFAPNAILLRAVATIVITGIVIPLTHSVVAAAAAVLLIWALRTVFDLRQLRRANPPTVATAGIAELLATGRHIKTLGVTAVLVSLAYYVPRYFIAATGTDSDLGYFGAISYFGLVVLMFAHAVSDFIVPTLTHSHRNALRSPTYLAAVRRLYGLIAAAGTTLLLAGMACGGPVLRMLFGADYAVYVDECLVLLLAGLFAALSACQAQVVVALQAARAQTQAAIFALAVLVAACAVLVPSLRIMGAAISELTFSVLYFGLVEWIIVRAIRVARQQGT